MTPAFFSATRTSLLLGWACLCGPGCSLSNDSSPASKRIQVFAASSLTDAFQALEQAFEARHPQSEVVLNIAGSQILRTQIQNGAQAHVFASADPRHVEALRESELVHQQAIFGHNRLALLVPNSNPSKLYGIEDLPQARRLVVGNEHTPIGQYTREMLQKASREMEPGFEDKVWARVVSEEPNARLLRTKVETGAVDAGVVYESDTLTAQNTRTVPIPPEYNVRADLTLATIATSQRTSEIDSFFQFVLSPEGQSILTDHGLIGRDKP